MNEMTLKKLQSIIHEDTAPCVSIYVPLYSEERRVESQKIYKNLLKNTEALLLTLFTQGETRRFMADLLAFDFNKVDMGPDATLVIFKSPTTQGYWIHRALLPGNTIVANSFHIKPILENFLEIQDYFVLSLAPDRAELFYGSPNVFEPVHTFEINHEETHQNLELLPKRGFRFFHSLEKFLLSSGFKLRDFFGEPIKKSFYTQVDGKIRNFLKGKNTPIILAGSTIDKARYRSISSCYQLRRASIRLGAEALVGDARAYLHSASRDIANAHYAKLRTRQISKINVAEREGLLALGLEQVFQALCKNQVETLFVNRDEVVWGTAYWDNGYFVLHPHQLNARDDDLIDDCIEKALRSKAQVVVVDRHQSFRDFPIAAILKRASHKKEIYLDIKRYESSDAFLGVGGR